MLFLNMEFLWLLLIRRIYFIRKKEIKVKPPKLFKVILLNDDFTPMEFVIDVLRKVFSMNNDKATLIMLAVHNKGKGVCGIYPRDIASTKVSQVISLAKEPASSTMFNGRRIIYDAQELEVTSMAFMMQDKENMSLLPLSTTFSFIG